MEKLTAQQIIEISKLSGKVNKKYVEDKIAAEETFHDCDRMVLGNYINKLEAVNKQLRLRLVNRDTDKGIYYDTRR